MVPIFVFCNRLSRRSLLLLRLRTFKPEQDIILFERNQKRSFFVTFSFAVINRADDTWDFKTEFEFNATFDGTQSIERIFKIKTAYLENLNWNLIFITGFLSLC